MVSLHDFKTAMERMKDERVLIDYFEDLRVIFDMLSTHHDIYMSLKTLKVQLKELILPDPPGTG